MGRDAREGSSEEEVVEEGPSREEAIAEAWDAAEAGGDEETPVETSAAEEVPVEEGVEEEGEEKVEAKGKGERDSKTGKFKPKGDDKEGEQQEVSGEKPAEEAAADEQQKLAQSAQNVKPPQTWRPLERQALAKIAATPEGRMVLETVTRREAQMADALKETQGIRQFTNEFSRVIEPHRGLLSMLNTSPLAAVNELMRTAAVLYQGDPQMKAQGIAQLIKARGIDPNLVADYLEGITPKDQPAHDPRVDQLTQQLAQLTSHLQGSVKDADRVSQEQANAKVAAWSKDKPHFEDVRGRMRTLIAAADSDGEELSLDDAYAIACSMDPQVSKLVEQQKKADAVKAKSAQLAKARRAGSSVRPENTRRGVGQATGDREADIAAAWDEVEGRA